MHHGLTIWLDWLSARMPRRFVDPAALVLPEPAPAIAPEPRCLGLALGGGGGKGAAHLGVLEVLAELDISIDVIVGTSAGGAVAILYAAGLSLVEIRDGFREMALRRVAVPDPTRTGLIGQRRRREILTRLLGDRTFADLAMPCAVVATDLVSGQSVLIRDGSLVEAALATTALPSIFPPVFRDGMVLVDGGILNNVPVNAAQELGAQQVIAVELNDAVPGFSLAPVVADNPLARLTLAPQQFAVASRALSLLMNHATALQLRENPPALLLSPSVADIATLDMSNPLKAYQAGVVAARDATAQLRDLQAWRRSEPVPEPIPEPATLPARPRLPFDLSQWRFAPAEE